jgi:hypothetical protein
VKERLWGLELRGDGVEETATLVSGEAGVSFSVWDSGKRKHWWQTGNKRTPASHNE